MAVIDNNFLHDIVSLEQNMFAPQNIRTGLVRLIRRPYPAAEISGAYSLKNCEISGD